MGQGIEFGIGVVDIADAVYHPGVAEGVGVLKRNGLVVLKGENEIFGVEHVENRIERVAVDAGHIAASFHEGRHEALHLGRDVGFDELLVTAQLGSVIAADTLMIVGGFVLIKSVRGEVEHTIVESFILKNLPVGGREGLRGVANGRLDKHVVVEVSLVHLPHVYQTQQSDGGNGVWSFQSFGCEEQQKGCSDDDDPERAPTVGGEDGLTDGAQIGKDGCELLGGELRQSTHFVGRDEVGKEDAGHQGEE